MCSSDLTPAAPENRLVPIDFLAPLESHNPIDDHHRVLLANCFAQSEALMRGKTEEQARAELQAKGFPQDRIDVQGPHKAFSGNRPSNTILVDKITPRTLGKLVAMYEHKIFTQGVIWNIFSFDQWGVELGKELAKKLEPELGGKGEGKHDGSTSGLVAHYRKFIESRPR